MKFKNSLCLHLCKISEILVPFRLLFEIEQQNLTKLLHGNHSVYRGTYNNIKFAVGLFQTSHVSEMAEATTNLLEHFQYEFFSEIQWKLEANIIQLITS